MHKNVSPTDLVDDIARFVSKDGSIHVTDERVNTITSLVGACLSLLGAAVLIAQAASSGKVWAIVAFSIYGLSLVTLFISSALHHAVRSTPKVERRLRTFDYVSVFGLIAGTVTPIVLVLDRTVVGWAVLGSIWAIALFGIVLRSLKHNLPRHITNTLYIVLGWLPAVLVAALTNLAVSAALLIVIGGIVYSLGFIVYTIEKPTFKSNSVFGFHELWHCLVIVAAACHYAFMYLYVLPR